MKLPGKIYLNKTGLLLLQVFTLLITLRCTNNPPVTGTITETDTGIAVCMPDGSPAIDAIIKFIPANRSQSTTLSKSTVNSGSAVVRTNIKGRFEVPQLADSIYNVFMEKDNLKAFQGSVSISPYGNAVHDDTLQQTGSFTATIGLDPKDIHMVGAVIVQILGSDVQFLNPDDSGNFTFKNIASGTYTLSLGLNEPGYSQTFFTMTIQSGVDSIYPDTIRMKYIGIPSIQGLAAYFDTSKGIISLNWLKSKYSNLLDYVIYRDESSSITYTKDIYKATADTMLIDTIFDITDTNSALSAKSYRYRVAIRDNSVNIGNSFGAVTVTATPYEKVLPVIDSISVNYDTLSGIANLTWSTNPAIDSTYDYILIRSISGYQKMIFGNGIYDTMVKRCDTIGHIQQKLFSDTLFPKIFSFGDTMTYQITYNLSVYKKSWKLNGSGKKSTLLLLYPYKHLIPVLSNFTINYDTIKGISYVARINASFDSNITGYRLIKTILNPQHAIVIIDTLPLLTLNTFFDTIYPNVIPFEETSGTELRYSIAAYNSKWQIYGDDVSRSTVVYSYKRFKPIANAGLDDMVDISSDVLLIGKVNSYTYRVTKMEWKIGENSWVEADSGKIFFSTNNDYHTENILCQFKVTDTMGNSTIDTTIITKKIQIKRLDNLPTYKASQIFLTKRLKTSDEFIMIAHKDVSTYSVWSTDDFTHFKVLIDDANINNDGQFFTFGGKYYFYNISQSNALKSYTSDDGCIWGDINPIITISNPIKWSQVLITENKCILTAKSVLRKAFRETILLL